MRSYVIDDVYKVKSGTASRGCQIKYFRNNYWYKIDGSCNEGNNENVVSLLLKCSSVDNFVYYERCRVNNKLACRSYNFLEDSEVYITLYDIISRVYNSDANNMIMAFNNIEDRFNFIINAVSIYTGNMLDYTDFLRCVLYLDMLILNRDRHLGNLGVVYDSTSCVYRTSPIFDNGLSLLGGCKGYVYEYGLESVINSQTSRTISGSFYQQAYYCTGGCYKSPFSIDFNRFFSLLDSNIDRLTYNVLQYQYKNLYKIFE